MRRLLLFISACLSVTALGALAWRAGHSGGPRASGPLGSQCYVWQRTWDDAVIAAVAGLPDSISGLAPLCAEISWDAAGQSSVARPALNFEALRASRHPVSAVLRIGPRDPSPDAQATVCSIAKECVLQMRVGGIEPCELQVDFDCAAARLGGYRAWLAALRYALRPIPVHPTVLPSWLARREFAALARESGAFILQVHATEKPRVNAPETALCEAANARKWTELAGRIGVPFRVALPTYTYRVAFDPAGVLLAIEAEGQPHAWPRGTVLRAFRPDAVQMAKLVNDWTGDRPATLTGLLWYRLPVSTDTMNWRWPTLAAVMQGRTPGSDLRVEQSGAQPTDITLMNAGEAEAPYPARVLVTCASEIDAADAVGGYRAEISGNAVVFERSEEISPARILPGRRHPIGWVHAKSQIQISILNQ